MPTEDRNLTLKDSLQFIKGVGPQVSALFGKAGIHTAGDLLRHYPRRWEDRTKFASTANASSGEWVTISAKILGVNSRYPKGPKMAITEALGDDGGTPIRFIWFNQPYMEKVFQNLATQRKQIVAYGQLKQNGWTLEMHSPEWEELNEESDLLSTSRIVPIYPAIEGMRQGRLRGIIQRVLETYLPCIVEPIPSDARETYQLMPAREALQQIHFPKDEKQLQEAKRRLIFEEFFLLQSLLALRRLANSHTTQGVKFSVDLEHLNRRIAEIVPFQLTGAQQRSIREVAADVASGRVMNRLIQGDVGSGKTMVALAAMLMATDNGYQAALMAPTEILASQHAIVLRRLLEPVGLKVELSIGSLKQKERVALREGLASGETKLVIGTHALIQEDIEFARLGMVVIDEQHRFGVLQRLSLAKKGVRPHILVMTATPIPRTLTLTLYGDLDVSLLNELPPGRKPITTHWRTREKHGQVYAAAQRLLNEGRQVYIVCPLVEESDKLQAKSAVEMAEHIRTNVFPQYRVGLLHGQMKPDDKDRIMAQFKAHELDILVSTTVIEVGIDVPNASVIIIEDADRFGLAQLHQLRGRVGRGAHASYCILIGDPKTEEGQARLEIMTQTRDGFRIAEEDLRIRGPGEFFGTKQSGMPDLLLGDILRDVDILAETREYAFQLVEKDPQLKQPEHSHLRRALQETRMGYELISVS